MPTVAQCVLHLDLDLDFHLDVEVDPHPYPKLDHNLDVAFRPRDLKGTTGVCGRRRSRGERGRGEEGRSLGTTGLACYDPCA